MKSLTSKPIRIAAVSFLNSAPLIDGLELEPAVQLTTAAPSALLSKLEMRKADVALIPTIDYQLARSDLRIIRAGAIGSLTTSLTVRLFCKKPIAEIKTLACDTDSHTSVFLARIILKELYNLEPDITRFTVPQTDAILLIGDKVITANLPKDYKNCELDLVEAWRKLTGLGFIFAVWACRAEFDRAEDAARILKATLQSNLTKLPAIAKKHAPLHNWPESIARQYLTENMYYRFDFNQLKALKLFYSYAHRLGLIKRHRLIRFTAPPPRR